MIQLADSAVGKNAVDGGAASVQLAPTPVLQPQLSIFARRFPDPLKTARPNVTPESRNTMSDHDVAATTGSSSPASVSSSGRPQSVRLDPIRCPAGRRARSANESGRV